MPTRDAHRASPRRLHTPPQEASPDTGVLWRDAQTVVDKEKGILVLDDTTLDKPYAKNMDLVKYHWSGKHHRVVKGITLITLHWTDGEAHIPCDFRVYDKPMGGTTKNEYFRDLLVEAMERGFNPDWVLFDSWYSSLGNLKQLRSLGWRWLTQLKSNRLIDPDRKGNVQVRDLEIPAEGMVVHLKGYGMVKVFRVFSKDGEVEHWATSDLDMEPEGRGELSLCGWGVEEYHRGIKQCCGVEKAQVRGAVAQLNHICCSIRAFIRLEVNRLKNGVSWYEAKLSIVRDAIRTYLVNPLFTLTPTAQVLILCEVHRESLMLLNLDLNLYDSKFSSIKRSTNQSVVITKRRLTIRHLPNHLRSFKQPILNRYYMYQKRVEVN